MMPVWDYDEMVSLRDTSYPLISDDEMKSYFSIWGGNPRRCFCKRKPTSRLHEIIANAKPANLRTLIGNCAVGFRSSHSILHIHTKDGKVVKEGKHKVDFASTYVVEQLISIHWGEKAKELAHFLHRLTEPVYGTMRGKLFESFCHNYISKGGSFKMITLGLTRSVNRPSKFKDENGEDLDEEDYDYEEELAQLSLSHSEIVADEIKWKQADVKYFSTYDDISGPGYWKPNDPNWPSIDGFLWPDKFFQITVAKSHSLLATATLAMFELVKRATGNPDPSYSLFIVVPSERAGRYKNPIEPMTGGGKKVKNVLLNTEKAACRKLMQLVLVVDLHWISMQ